MAFSTVKEVHICSARWYIFGSHLTAGAFDVAAELLLQLWMGMHTPTGSDDNRRVVETHALYRGHNLLIFLDFGKCFQGSSRIGIFEVEKVVDTTLPIRRVSSNCIRRLSAE